MCLTEPALVIETGHDELRVLVGGHERRVTNLLVPDATVGDYVVIGLGIVLARTPGSDHQAAAAPQRRGPRHIAQGGT